jgi:predicted nucleic acid-binding protein
MPNSSRICVDARILVRLLGSSPHPAIQNRWDRWLSERTSIVAPRLLRYEIVNAFRQMVRTNELSEEGARFPLRAMLELPVVLHDDDQLHLDALTFACRFNLPATYDALYLALAERLDCPFWTADKRLARAVQKDLPWVRLLEY